MNVPSGSQCSSSGCESGWTSYLEQSSFSQDYNYDGQHSFGGYNSNVNNIRVKQQHQADGDGDEEEEDLSMVSDASSGPPTYCEEDEDSIQQKNTRKKKSSDSSRSSHQFNHQHQYLDDTASSPVLKGKKVNDNVKTDEFSQGFSATHLKGKASNSNKKKHFGFFRSSHSSVSK
ncbi:Protein SOB FIVE-LIKE 5 [Linum perenne]